MADDSKATDVGARYAKALFDLAKDEGRIAAVESDLKSLKAMLASSPDLRTLLASPKFGAADKARTYTDGLRADKAKGLAGVAAKAKLNATTQKFLGLLAANGRAGALASVITSFEALSAIHRGAVSAEVTSAVALTAAQSKGVASALRQALGKDPEITTRVDASILGGIKVRVGSRLYDASLKSKLDQLKFALKRA